MEDNIQKIYGLIGYSLLAYYHYHHKDDNSKLILYGYIALALVYVPWYFNSEIKHKIETKKQLENEEKIEDYLEKIGHSLISLYYASKLMDKVDLHGVLGLIGNLLILSKFKKQATMILIGYYILSIIHSHANIGSSSLVLYYYYTLNSH
jgi:glucose uptake protein GlcU